MNRKQFMEQLERLLSDISEAERQEALEYYEGYFDDAGPENEGEVIRELGNPVVCKINGFSCIFAVYCTLIKQ